MVKRQHLDEFLLIREFHAFHWLPSARRHEQYLLLCIIRLKTKSGVWAQSLKWGCMGSCLRFNTFNPEDQTDTYVNSVDFDETAYEPSHQNLPCAPFRFNSKLTPLNVSVDVFRFKDGRVHFRNSAMKGFKITKLMCEFYAFHGLRGGSSFTRCIFVHGQILKTEIAVFIYLMCLFAFLRTPLFGILWLPYTCLCLQYSLKNWWLWFSVHWDLSSSLSTLHSTPPNPKVVGHSNTVPVAVKGNTHKTDNLF